MCAITWGAAKAETLDVVLNNGLNSDATKIGDRVEARLATPLKKGKKIVAPAGSTVVGHVTEVSRTRRLLHAELSTKRWFRCGGNVAMEFEQIMTPSGTLVPVKARPLEIVSATKAHHAENGKTPAPDRYTVTKDGAVEYKRKKDLLPKATRIALGVGAIFAAPVTATVGGVAGAVKPSTVLPQSDNPKAQQHRRLKGMATGIVAGLPGGFIVNDAVMKGEPTKLSAGTRMRLEVAD